MDCERGEAGHEIAARVRYTRRMDMTKRIEAARATPLQRRVWRALCRIPRGTAITYAELAKRVGKPRAVRAVASAVGKNPFAPAVPCHRVVRSDGSLGGYSAPGGLRRKRELLKREGVQMGGKRMLRQMRRNDKREAGASLS